MKPFRIEQIAISVKDTPRAKELLAKLGIKKWVTDTVVANGEVFYRKGENTAELSYNYDVLDSPREFEILDYKQGNNWIDFVRGRNIVSHLGMHCTEEELNEYKEFFKSENISIAQEVYTSLHTNPAIAGKRKYHYCIFDTKDILGVDLKFIVRINLNEGK